MLDDDSMSLGEAREWLRKRIDKGEVCPCCTQFAKIYPRQIYGAEARGLIKMLEVGGEYPNNWVNVPSLGLPGGDLLKTRFWGLIERYPEERREDGSKRVGVWRLTPRGEDFVNDHIKVLKIAMIYNNKLLYLDHSSGYIGIRDALGSGFDYNDLMGN